MSEPNPYAPPKARVEDPQSSAGDLAGRPERLGAAILDGLISAIWALPLGYALGEFEGFPRVTRLPLPRMAALALLSFVLFAVVQGYFLKTNGQTIGKKVVGMRIATLEGGVPPLSRMLGLRYLPFTIAGLTPYVGGLVNLIDVLFIFRADRRCLHDHLAGTRVVKA